MTDERKFTYGEKMTAMMLATWWKELSAKLGIRNDPFGAFHPDLVLNALADDRDGLIETDALYADGNDSFADPDCQTYSDTHDVLGSIIEQYHNGLFPPFSGISDSPEHARAVSLILSKFRDEKPWVDYSRPSKPWAVWKKLARLIDDDVASDDEIRTFVATHFPEYRPAKTPAGNARTTN